MSIEQQQRAIREGLAKKLFDIAMTEWQVYGQATLLEAWENEAESYRATADVLLAFLTEQGAVLKVEGAPLLPSHPCPILTSEGFTQPSVYDSVYQTVVDDMKAAGFTTTAPLVEPEKPSGEAKCTGHSG